MSVFPSVPLPTDNIYKFVCIFGLSMFIVGVLGSVSVFSTDNAQMSRFIEEMSAAEAMQDRARAQELIKRFEALNEIQRFPKFISLLATSLSIGVGLSISAAGFWLWAKKKQKQDDRLQELQIAKLEAEIASLRSAAKHTREVPR